MAGDDGFLQEPPHLGNQYEEDEYLRSHMHRLIPAGQQGSLERDLESFGWEVATSIKAMGFQGEEEPPTIKQLDAWGRRVHTVVTSPAWMRQKEISAREGLVAIAYERQYAQHSRIYQIAKLVLYGASSGLFNCPLAMTDGAARVCELQRPRLPELEDAFYHLTSRDPFDLWISGQWMTEKAGGSDVSTATETMAVAEESGSAGVGAWYRLYGYKWFTSAADGEMAFALGRECGPDGKPIPGNRGLALFFVPIERDAEGCPKGFQVVRLKNKLGTKQLPTAELRLQGMRALKVSELGRGVPAIASMVNITRVHNAAAAVSYMRRITSLAQDYARRRSAFGAPLAQQPLALRTLSWLEVHTCTNTALLLEVARLLGLQETGLASPADASLLRLLTPLAKLFTAKEAVAVASEGLEFFGGQGYIEDTHIPGILRDAQVLPIWEGSTNVLCLDLLRVLGGDPGAAPAFLESCTTRLDTIAATAAADAAAGGSRFSVRWGVTARGGAKQHGGSVGGAAGAAPAQGQEGQAASSSAGHALPAAHAALLQQVCAAIEGTLQGVERALLPTAAAVQGSAGKGAGLPEGAQAGARDLAFLMTRTFMAVLLAEHAAWSSSPRHLLLAAEWCREELPRGGSLAAAAESNGRGRCWAGAAAEVSAAEGVERGGRQEGWEGVRARVEAARVIARVDEPLQQPRARF